MVSLGSNYEEVLLDYELDGTGVEDTILRLDCNIPEAFGSGFSAIAISRTSECGEIEIVSRYPDGD